jgi:flavodoxin
MTTLIAFATRHGVTEKTAKLLAKVLGEMDGRQTVVRKASLLNKIDLSECDNCIVGSSITMGRWKGSAKRALRRAFASGKPVAVFVTAAGTMSGKQPGSAPDAEPVGTIEEREAIAISKYIDPVVEKIGGLPVAKGAFGGRMVMFGKEIFDNWDESRIRSWAADISVNRAFSE